MRPRFHAIEFSFKESASGPSGTPYGRELLFMKKSNKSVRRASEYKTRNKIQKGAGALLGEIDGASYIADPDIHWLINQVISSLHTTAPGVGMPLGNLTSQLLVNVYMHEFDMYLKQELRVKYYLRYSDDFAILTDDRKYLEDILPKLHVFLNEKLRLTLHEHKVYIKTYDSGVDFLGWVHFPHHRQIRTTTKRKVIRMMKGYPKRETVSSYRGLLGHGDTHLLQKRLKIIHSDDVVYITELLFLTLGCSLSAV